jgi:hypothetical protein
MKHRPRLPNFLIVGSMMSGTIKLHDQLARQPGIFMSEPKETNFFSDDARYECGVSFYDSLFEGAHGAALRGESSTHYTQLPTYPRTVRRIQSLLPDVKIIYMMRHPVERLIAHYHHDVSLRLVQLSLDRAVERHPEIIDYGCYHMQLAPYFEAYGRNNVLPVFLERLQRDPQRELERVCAFLGYGGEPVWIPDSSWGSAESHGRLGNAARRARQAPIVALLSRVLVPAGVRDFIQGVLPRRKTPSLSEAALERVKVRFDYDLMQLGAELGVPSLRCDNFKSVVCAEPLRWCSSEIRDSVPPRATAATQALLNALRPRST